MVTFRPFNGATVIDCNFATASIFAIWREKASLDGHTGRDLVGAACAVYGSRTSLVTYNTQNDRVEELTLLRMGEKERWIVTTPDIKIGPKAKLFAPALKSSFEYPNYLKIFEEFCMRGYSIRYSGAAACDIYQMFVKGQGVYAKLDSISHPSNLRILYECIPLAFLIEKAGGISSNLEMSILDIPISGF